MQHNRERERDLMCKWYKVIKKDEETKKRKKKNENHTKSVHEIAEIISFFLFVLRLYLFLKTKFLIKLWCERKFMNKRFEVTEHKFWCETVNCAEWSAISEFWKKFVITICLLGIVVIIIRATMRKWLNHDDDEITRKLWCIKEWGKANKIS